MGLVITEAHSRPLGAWGGVWGLYLAEGFRKEARPVSHTGTFGGQSVDSDC